MENSVLKAELLNIAKPILFNTEMVKAILEGRKTVTRRLVKPRQLIGLGCDKCPNNMPEEYIKEKKMLFKPYCDMTDNELISAIYKEPYLPGDILYVRETWSEWTGGYLYKAWHGPFPQPGQCSAMKWHPSLHMPKEAARIFLKVKEVRVERLKDMTLADVLMEGITEADTYEKTWERWHNIWDSTINKSDLERYGWDANPYVWVIKFERIELESGV